MRLSRINTDTIGYKEFYFDFNGDVQLVEALNPVAKGQIVLTAEEAEAFTGIPLNEWKRLIAENKIKTCIQGGFISYPDVMTVKYWWDEYQKEECS
ncbi:hypothetical protein [Gorillibacterium timonense]|uniref:hypothetical protein n=1 Tax=Gorillibacterium timonense TaxID=1689269 RepID=UPI00071CF722|nr:hypothetical protein [Gorillibacterium timonense]